MKPANELETELKLYILDLRQVEARLKKLGAELIQPRQLETNLRFDQPGLSLERGKKALRLRFDTQARLTYKGPSTLINGALSRIELEITVDDFNTTIRLLEALGYHITVKYEKQRTTYKYQNCHIMLDELPIGNFVEIEGSDPGCFSSVARDLGLNSQKAIPMSYIELFNHACKEHGFDKTKLTFAAFEKTTVKPEHLDVVPADID
jgi:adenylate cyclase class 2